MAKSVEKAKRSERGYADLRDHVAALERAGLLVRVKREINKDTEMHPLVRWQYRGGLAEKEWRGFLFEQVSDDQSAQWGKTEGTPGQGLGPLILASRSGCNRKSKM